MQEAKISFNMFVEHENGYKGQVTVRGDSADEWVATYNVVVNELMLKGFKPEGKRQPAAPLQAQQQTPPPPEDDYFPLEDEPQQPPQQQAQASNAENVIEVESIFLASGGDHPRWAVRGGVFVKYGITCWPEVLEAAGILGSLDATKENVPNGKWMAYYVEKQKADGGMTPDKVTKLVRV